MSLAGGFAFSNGIAVSADDQTLVVADPFMRSLIAFSLAGPRSRTLLITEHSLNSLWRTTWDCAGQAQRSWPPTDSPLKPL